MKDIELKQEATDYMLEHNERPNTHWWLNKLHQAVAEERACRLFLQDMWNDESAVQALSQDGKEIILGGLVGEEITKTWLKIKERITSSAL